MAVINPIAQIEFDGTQSSRTYMAIQNICVSGDYIYIIPHLGYFGAPNAIVKFNRKDFTYKVKSFGSGFTSGAPIVDYSSEYLVAVLGTTNYSTYRLYVIDKETLEFLRIETITHPFPTGDWSTPTDLYLRSDGGLTLGFYCKNRQADSIRNKYIINFNPVSDILNDEITKMNEFHLGTTGWINRCSNGVIIYKPSQANAMVNQGDYRFTLNTTDDTLQTIYYGDGTQAPVPFTPSSADYSKINSMLEAYLIPPVIGIYNDGKYFGAGKDLNKYGSYEIYDDNFNMIDHWISMQADSELFYYGSKEYLLFHQNTSSGGILKLLRISDKQMKDIQGLYSKSPWSITYYCDERYLFLFDAKYDYSIARVTIFDATELGISPPKPSYLYPFWYGR